MIPKICGRGNVLARKLWTVYASSTRGLLSAGYLQDEAWQKRLNEPLLSRISPEVSQRFNKRLVVGAVDIDIFANIVSNESQIDELEHLLYNLRRTRRTIDTLDSTHHAACRLYFKTNQHARLLEILQKRVDYGLFPDHFCYNALLDHYIESKNWRDAAKTASNFVLQEDFTNAITCKLAVHAIHEYLKDDGRQDWVDIEKTEENTEVEEVDEDDVEYVRIPVIRNKHFDDHFDLKDGLELCGKALHYISRSFSDPLKTNLQLLGYTFHKKWDRASHILESSESKMLAEDTLNIVKAHVGKFTESENQSDTMKLFLQELPQFQMSPTSSLEQMIIQELKEIPTLEKNDMTLLEKKMNEWSSLREKALKRSVDELMRDQRIKEIMAKRKELEEREKLLFFFENISKHEKELEEAEEKISQLQASAVVEEDYIPPKL